MSAHLASTPVSPRQAWSRLGLLGAVLAAAFALVALVVVWLVPTNAPSRTVTYPLADLEVGVPVFFRPFEMGGDAAGTPHGIWLVRTADDDVIALWSRTAHPSDCNLRPWIDGSNAFTNAPAIAGIPIPNGAPAFFRTGCLGSTFLLDGTRTFGPAPRGLDRFRTRVEGSYVSINTTWLIVSCPSAYDSDNCPADGQPVLRRFDWRRSY